VLKASEKCPRVHAAVAAAINDAGVPAGVINLVSHAASFGAFMNSGQICMSTERIVADASIAGTLATALEHVLELIADARAKGAAVSGGEDAGTTSSPPPSSPASRPTCVSTARSPSARSWP
jgi:hypothetical protein